MHGINRMRLQSVEFEHTLCVAELKSNANHLCNYGRNLNLKSVLKMAFLNTSRLYETGDSPKECQVWDSHQRTLGVAELKSCALDHSVNLTILSRYLPIKFT